VFFLPWFRALDVLWHRRAHVAREAHARHPGNTLWHPSLKRRLGDPGEGGSRRHRSRTRRPRTHGRMWRLHLAGTSDRCASLPANPEAPPSDHVRLPLHSAGVRRVTPVADGVAVPGAGRRRARHRCLDDGLHPAPAAAVQPKLGRPGRRDLPDRLRRALRPSPSTVTSQNTTVTVLWTSSCSAGGPAAPRTPGRTRSRPDSPCRGSRRSAHG
jgi:hypothetical protein